MKLTRMEKIQREIIDRYDNISNLYIAYMNCGKHSDEFGREFFHAVGDVLQGRPVRQLTLYHLDPRTIESIVDHTLHKGGVAGEGTKSKPKPKKEARAKGNKKKVSARKVRYAKRSSRHKRSKR